MNIFIELCNIVGTVLYTAYDVLLLSCIIIIYPFESLESNMIVHTTCINACNNWEDPDPVPLPIRSVLYSPITPPELIQILLDSLVV